MKTNTIAIDARLNAFTSTDVNATTLDTLKRALTLDSQAGTLTERCRAIIAELPVFPDVAEYRAAFKAWREMATGPLGYVETYARTRWSAVGGSKLNPDHKPRGKSSGRKPKAAKSGKGKATNKAASGLTLSKDESKLVAMLRDDAALPDAIHALVDDILTRRK